jgi:hypothetical protein
MLRREKVESEQKEMVVRSISWTRLARGPELSLLLVLCTTLLEGKNGLTRTVVPIPDECGMGLRMKGLAPETTLLQPEVISFYIILSRNENMNELPAYSLPKT